MTAARTKKRSKPTLNGMTVLVCGGAGFIGSNFIRLVLKRYPRARVVNVDKITYSGNLDNLRDIAKDRRYTFVRGDIASKKKMLALFKKYKPDYVINFAAETHVDRSIHVGALEFIHTNIVGVFNLLEAVRQSGKVKKYVQVSTDEVYGSLPLKGGKVFTETSPLKPNSPYAASKAAGDLVARSFFQTYGTPVVITRSSNNYGPYQHPEKLIPFFILRLLNGKTVPLYGDGKYVRDWVHVEDHCAAVIRVMENGIPGEIYNIGASVEVANIDIARQLTALLGRDASALAFVKDRPGHDRRYAIDSGKIRRELGWKPRQKFDAAFPATVKWYVEHGPWVARAVRRTGMINKHVHIA